MADIFVCYRRADSRGDAGRLADSLEERFSECQVFRDVESLVPGDDYTHAIKSTIAGCAVLLAVIGPRWLTLRGDDGARRLDAPDDFIRLEIASAFAHGIKVIPVLVGGAQMPARDDLPQGLEPLALQQAIEISDTRWDHDIQRLVSVLETLPGLQPALWQRLRPRAGALTATLATFGVLIASTMATRMSAQTELPEFGASLPPMPIDLAVDAAASGNCLYPDHCDEPDGPQYSTLIRIDDNVVKIDRQSQTLHVGVVVSWKKRQGHNRVFERSYAGMLYYTGAYHIQADSVVVDTLTLAGESLRPSSGLIAYCFGWVELMSMARNDTSVPRILRQRLNRAQAIQALAEP